jgi:two-component system sensor histidine kinase CpxA
MADGNFQTSLNMRAQDELGRLAASIESMGRRLGAQVAEQKRFLGDTAHELRSPLGRMQVALAILDRNPDKGNLYLPGLNEDVTEMTRLTDDLLQLAREELMARTAVAKATNVASAVQRACRIESRPGDDIRLDVPSGLEAMIDPDALFRAVANVLRNALRYAGDAGPITVTARAAGDMVMVTVADQGPGVPQDALPRLFEPFYRVDETRDRKTGGVGQGLAIVRSAVQACGGTVSCRNLTPRGLEVRLTVPRVVQQPAVLAATLSPAEHS